jgi:hypothetical protein
MRLEFTGEIWEWRGPAPFHFVTVPEAEAGMIAAASELVTYGWGMIPVTGTAGNTAFTTSLWPQNGGYVVPIKAAVRTAEGLGIGDTVRLVLEIAV